MPKVTFVGAGSAVFARQLITDILAVDGLDAGTFALVDIDPARLELARRIAERLVELSGKRWSVTASTERTDVLEGSDYVISSIEVAGLANVRYDYEIPMRYGVDQCIGDTIGPGGIFKALRTGPVWLQIVAPARELPRLSLQQDHVALRGDQPQRVVHDPRARRPVPVPAAAPARDDSGNLRTGSGAFRGDASPWRFRHRVERTLLGVRPVLSQAARPGSQLHAGRLPGGERLLREQLAGLARAND